MIRVEINTLVADRTPVPKDIRGIGDDTLQNLQSKGPKPVRYPGFEWWPENINLPTFNSDTHKQGSEILTVDEPAKTVDVTYNVDALDAGELADVLADRKRAKIKLLKAEGLSRVHALFPAIATWDEIMLVKESWLSIASAARNPTPKFLSLINIFVAGSDAADAINAMTNVNAIDAYNVTTDPVWP